MLSDMCGSLQLLIDNTFDRSYSLLLNIYFFIHKHAPYFNQNQKVFSVHKFLFLFNPPCTYNNFAPMFEDGHTLCFLKGLCKEILCIFIL